ncbi:hypothetical protein ZWY2020_024924 [Hordeum vulgare]|nr:hypothetical protein ZWY2020_024924 [Hordeum vulgare]
MFDKDLVVVEEYVPSKRLEDYEFNDIPIWLHVFKLPLGMMNEESAEEIGNIIGKFVEADSGVYGNAIEMFMRIKIKMKIDKTIMRGFTLEDEEGNPSTKKSVKYGKDEEDDGGWCRFEYEYLSDFCYTCG